jgi:hypothetical protein
MRKLLTLLLVGLSVICSGQTHKCPMCKVGMVTWVSNPYGGHWQCGRCGELFPNGTAFDLKPVGNSKPQKRLNVNYVPTSGHSTLVNSLVEDNKIIKNDTTNPLHVGGYISAYPIYNGYTGWTTTTPNEYLTVGNGCNKVKVSVTKDLIVTIHIDGFQVTDTIWITKGKQKVGVPAYKFLDYFKEDYPSLTLPSNNWGGSLNRNTLEYHITPTTK